MTIDVTLAAKVPSIIAKAGVAASYERVTGTHDAASGAVGVSVATTEITCSMLVPVRQSLVNGTTVRVDDSLTVVAGSALAFVPKIGDRLVVAGARWSIVAVRSYSGGVQIAHELVVRR